MQDEKSKPFPMPGTVWTWRGDDQVPAASGPHRVAGLRWQSGEVQAVFTEDDRFPGYACASVGHMMRLAAWVCEAPTMPADEREKRARELYERVSKKQWGARALPWEMIREDVREAHRVTVDVIGEIERERHPLRVVKADPEDMWADYRTEREHMTASHRLGFLAGVAAERERAEASPPAVGLSEAYLAEIAARCAAATPGPWAVEDDTWPPLLEVWTAGIGGVRLGRFEREQDTAFAVHAREDVPALLAEVDRLRQIAGVKVGVGPMPRQPLTEAEARVWAGQEVEKYGAPGPNTRLRERMARLALAANRGLIPSEVRPWTATRELDRQESLTGPEEPYDEALDLAAGTWTGEDPLALDPEDGTLCGGCRAPRNAIHSPLCPIRAGAKVGRVPSGTTMLNGAEPEASTPTDEHGERINYRDPEPWSPKPGDRVRTEIDEAKSPPSFSRRRSDATGEVLHGAVLWDRWVRHDDGTEAPYDEDELRPEPTVAAYEAHMQAVSAAHVDASIVCTCPPVSEYDPPCAVHGVVGLPFDPNGGGL